MLGGTATSAPADKQKPSNRGWLTADICRVLGERGGHRAPRVRFEIELEDHLSRHDAKDTIRIATAWARYAEVFSYDDKTGMLSALA